MVQFYLPVLYCKGRQKENALHQPLTKDIMTLSILAISALSSFTLLAPGGEMREQTRVSIPEGNQIEVARGTETKQVNLLEIAQRDGTENVAFLMGDELHERVAANKPVEDLIFAVQPQPESDKFTLAVYQDNQQGKESPMLAVYPSSNRVERTLAHKDGGIQFENAARIEDKQDKSWTTAFTSSERTEQTGRNLV
jgi:hypothetical protein